jgi:hypothetical protein
MAIKDFKNIENINLNLDSTAQLVDSKDLTIFKTGAKNITDFGMSKNDVIEFRVYDISNNLLQQNNGVSVRYIHKDDLTKYLKSDIDTITQEKIFEIDVEKLVREAGYGNGEFKVSFNFLKNYVGNEDKKQRVWIHEVSPSRSEIRVMPLLGTDIFLNGKISNRYNGFLNKSNELRGVVNIIQNALDSIENNISDLIDKYFIEKHGQNWLNVIMKDYQFNSSSYTTFKQKIFSDFKKSVNYQLSGRDFDITSTNYGNIANTPFDLDEFYSTNEIYNILGNRLSESINYWSRTIGQYSVPPVIQESIKQDTDSQLLQSLLNTNYNRVSNLTQNDRLGVIQRDAIIIDTKPEVTSSVILPPPPPVEPPPPPPPVDKPIPIDEMPIDYTPGGGGSGDGGGGRGYIPPGNDAGIWGTSPEFGKAESERYK